MMTNENSLLKELEKNKKWPLRYMFKFIAPNEEETIAQIKKELPANGKTMAKLSKNGNYVSITCVALMQSAQEIVTITTKVNAIKGIVCL